MSGDMIERVAHKQSLKGAPDMSSDYEPRNAHNGVRFLGMPIECVVVHFNDGKPVVSIACKDEANLDMLDEQARQILDAYQRGLIVPPARDAASGE